MQTKDSVPSFDYQATVSEKFDLIARAFKALDVQPIPSEFSLYQLLSNCAVFKTRFDAESKSENNKFSDIMKDNQLYPSKPYLLDADSYQQLMQDLATTDNATEIDQFAVRDENDIVEDDTVNQVDTLIFDFYNFGKEGKLSELMIEKIKMIQKYSIIQLEQGCSYAVTYTSKGFQMEKTFIYTPFGITASTLRAISNFVKGDFDFDLHYNSNYSHINIYKYQAVEFQGVKISNVVGNLLHAMGHAQGPIIFSTAYRMIPLSDHGIISKFTEFYNKMFGLELKNILNYPFILAALLNYSFPVPSHLLKGETLLAKQAFNTPYLVPVTLTKIEFPMQLAPIGTKEIVFYNNVDDLKMLTNEKQADYLIKNILVKVAKAKNTVFIDLFCGVGALLLQVSKAFQYRLIGYEIDTSTYEAAKANLKNVKNVAIYNESIVNVDLHLVKNAVIFVDPPWSKFSEKAGDFALTNFVLLTNWLSVSVPTDAVIIFKIPNFLQSSFTDQIAKLFRLTKLFEATGCSFLLAKDLRSSAPLHSGFYFRYLLDDKEIRSDAIKILHSFGIVQKNGEGVETLKINDEVAAKYIKSVLIKNDLSFPTFTSSISAYISEGMDLLDFGCGSGIRAHQLMSLYSHKIKIVGIDPYVNPINVPIEIFPNISELTRSYKNKFDIVYSNMAFHHLVPGDPVPTLLKLVNLVKKDGYVIIRDYFSASEQDILYNNIAHFIYTVMNSEEKWVDAKFNAITVPTVPEVSVVVKSANLLVLKRSSDTYFGNLSDESHKNPVFEEETKDEKPTFEDDVFEEQQTVPIPETYASTLKTMESFGLPIPKEDTVKVMKKSDKLIVETEIFNPNKHTPAFFTEKKFILYKGEVMSQEPFNSVYYVYKKKKNVIITCDKVEGATEMILKIWDVFELMRPYAKNLANYGIELFDKANKAPILKTYCQNQFLKTYFSIRLFKAEWRNEVIIEKMYAKLTDMLDVNGFRFIEKPKEKTSSQTPKDLAPKKIMKDKKSQKKSSGKKVTFLSTDEFSEIPEISTIKKEKEKEQRSKSKKTKKTGGKLLEESDIQMTNFE